MINPIDSRSSRAIDKGKTDMTDEKVDQGSDAARSDPKTADRDREQLKKDAEKNIRKVMQDERKDDSK